MQPKCSVCFDNLCLPETPAVVIDCGHVLCRDCSNSLVRRSCPCPFKCNDAKALRGRNVRDLAISLSEVDTSDPEVVNAIKKNYKKELWFRIKDIQNEANKKMEHAKTMEGLIANQNESFSRHTQVQQEMILHRTDLTERLANARRILKESLILKGRIALELTGKRRTLRDFRKKLRELQHRRSLRSNPPPLPSNVQGEPPSRDSSQSSLSKRPLESDSSESSEEEAAQEDRRKCSRVA